MLIDWFTVGAQVLNFLILVWLLKRFLYKPILHAIDAREKRIAAELADAAVKKEAAKKEREEFQNKNEAFERERDDLLKNAKEEVSKERLRLLDEARQAVEDLHAKRRDALQREQQSLSDEITRRTREEVFAIAQKTLTDLAGICLEERMSEVFMNRLRELEGDAKEAFAKGFEESAEPVLVRSAFDLSAEQRTAIQKALNETLSADIQLRFEVEPDVISGIELIANGHKVAWSIADHLASLGKSVRELLKESSKAEGKPETPTSGAESP